MIEMILPFFSSIPGGEETKKYQLERYQSCIDTLLTQKPDNLENLFDILINSKSEDITEEFKIKDYDPNYQSPLREALNQFRRAKLDPIRRI